jgi:ABC-type dipeptide/oligopeptide/nickel transport system permease subunit
MIIVRVFSLMGVDFPRVILNVSFLDYMGLIIYSNT